MCEHFDLEKSDNLRTNGDYDEFALCSFFHLGVVISCKNKWPLA